MSGRETSERLLQKIVKDWKESSSVMEGIGRIWEPYQDRMDGVWGSGVGMGGPEGAGERPRSLAGVVRL